MRSARRVAALLAGLTVGWAGAPGGALLEPAAAMPPAPEPNGWAPVFAADFSGGALPQGCTAFDGLPGGQTASYYRPDEVQVSGGMLRLSIRRRDFADRPYTSGGLGCYDVSQLYGRYEFRARTAPGVGIDSYITLWPEQGSQDDMTVVEVFATEGRQTTVRLANGAGAAQNNEEPDGPGRQEISGRFSDDFHTYTVEWSPNGLRVLIDDRVRLVDSRASGKRRWFGFAVGTGDEDSGLPHQNDLPAEFLVDWVRVYAYAPGATGIPLAASPAPASPPAPGGQAPAVADHGSTWPVTVMVVAVSAVVVLVAVAVYRVVGRTRRTQAAHRA